jgi:hypothetical protein
MKVFSVSGYEQIASVEVPDANLMVVTSRAPAIKMKRECLRAALIWCAALALLLQVLRSD